MATIIILASFLLGFITGIGLTFYILIQAQKEKIIRNYEAQIRKLKEEHNQEIKIATKRSLDGSRAAIKGKISEQIAPILPNFKYFPSDARFIGDPIDYLIFNGYTDLKDGIGSEENLEVILLDIKTGQSKLSPLQQAIKKAIELGRVRFEVIRPEIPVRETIIYNNYSDQPSSEQAKFDSLSLDKHRSRQNDAEKSYDVKEIQKNHPKAYSPWTTSEDEKLRIRYQEGASISTLAKEFQRQPGGIRARLKKLGLLR